MRLPDTAGCLPASACRAVSHLRSPSRPATATFTDGAAEQMIPSLATGPFMNGISQNGLRRASVTTPVSPGR
jgi:hypothetical protein